MKKAETRGSKVEVAVEGRGPKAEGGGPSSERQTFDAEGLPSEARRAKESVASGAESPGAGIGPRSEGLPSEARRAKEGCESCPSFRTGNLERLGLDVTAWDYLVALAGNPNTGKSTVFNALTGLRQHTGNWPGKTVTRAEGGFRYGGRRFKLVDLPGTYSLLAASVDEEVARNFLLFGRPDVTVVVVDATRLERNLNLVLQILEITSRVVLCLNLMDEARRGGLTVDDRRLARDLGIPVVPTAARQREGMETLLQAVHDVASGKTVCTGHKVQGEPPALKQAVKLLVSQLESAFPGLPNARWIALRLLEGDSRIIEAVKTREVEGLVAGGERAGFGFGAPEPGLGVVGDPAFGGRKGGGT